MSEPAPQPGLPPTGPGRVVGTFLVLLLLLGVLAWIGSGLFSSPVDGAAKQREYFGANALPFGLALESAVRLPGGDSLVRFARAETSDTAPLDSAPLDVVLLEFVSRGAADALLRPSGMEGMGGAEMQLQQWQKDKSFAWHMTRKRGDLAFGPWSTKFLIERAYAQGGGWSEEARVDLSSKERALVLLAHWPKEKQVDEAALRQLLSVVALAPPKE